VKPKLIGEFLGERRLEECPLGWGWDRGTLDRLGVALVESPHQQIRLWGLLSKCCGRVRCQEKTLVQVSYKFDQNTEFFRVLD
jgi:hypothetical protein